MKKLILISTFLLSTSLLLQNIYAVGLPRYCPPRVHCTTANGEVKCDTSSYIWRYWQLRDKNQHGTIEKKNFKFFMAMYTKYSPDNTMCIYRNAVGIPMVFVVKDNAIIKPFINNTTHWKWESLQRNEANCKHTNSPDQCVFVTA